MKAAHPLLSIVTPVFNGAQYLGELIESVRGQDYPSIEHIIIDDGSSDDGATVAVLRKYPHLRWWTRPNRGAYATINEGLAASTGELVTVICADDKYAVRTAISAAVELWSRTSGADAVYGETIWIDAAGRELDRQPPQSGPVWLFPYYPVITHCSLLVSRAFIIDRRLFFDLTFPYVADYDWILRLGEAGCRFARLRKPIAMFRQHAAQRSQEADPAREEERRLVMQSHGELNPLLAWIVNKWWRLTKLRNLVVRRGAHACVEAIRCKLGGAAARSPREL